MPNAAQDMGQDVTVEQRQMPSLQMRAAIAPTSLNVEQRTVEMDFTAGGLVLRWDWETGVRFWEKLSTNPKHIRLERLNNGAPLLNSHRGYDLDDVIGVVEAGTVRLTGEKGSLRVRFAGEDDVEAQKVFRKVKDGIIQNVSVGYQVYRYEDAGFHEDGRIIRLATDWEPYEVSAVAMGADSGAGFRSANGENGAEVQTNTVDFVTRSNNTQGEVTMKKDANGNVIAEPTVTAPAAVDAAAVRAEAIAEERTRVAGINQAVRAAGLKEEFAAKLIADGVALDAARATVLEELAKPAAATEVRGNVRIEMSSTHNEHAATQRGIENALLHRSDASVALTDEGRQFRADTLLDVAKQSLAMHGVNTRGMTKNEVAGAALRLSARAGGAHSTSDFADTLANVANKKLRRAYELNEQTYRVLGRQENLPDYKVNTLNQFGEAPSLSRVIEGAEYTRGTIGEAKEQWQLLKYGKMISITREVIVNDDLNAFTRMPAAFGASAADLEGDLFYQQLTSNPTMGDGVALFHASHGNLLSGGGSVLAEAGLTASRTLLRKQKALDGKKILNIKGKYIVVPAALETTGEKLLGSTLASQANDINVFRNKYDLVVEARLDDASATAWYMFADPARYDTMVYGYMQGEEGPQIEQRMGFDVDGIDLKCRLDFAVKPVDFRAIQRNVGA